MQVSKKLLCSLAGIALIGAVITVGCGKDKIDSSGVGNAIAKKVGGTSTVKLPPNMKLINVSWKTNSQTNKTSLYYLYRPMRPDEFAETYKYQEDSTWGVLESTVIIIETKTQNKQ